jgi:hypothetical protein
MYLCISLMTLMNVNWINPKKFKMIVKLQPDCKVVGQNVMTDKPIKFSSNINLVD